MVAQAKVIAKDTTPASMPVLGYTVTQQQVEQLARLLPSTSKASSKAKNSYDVDEEIDYLYRYSLFMCCFQIFYLDT